MTICISIKVPDGLMLAADNMASYTVMNPATQGWDVIQSYSYAHKLSQLGEVSIGTLAWGNGSLQRRSIQNIIEDFVRQNAVAQYSDVKLAADGLATFMRTLYEKEYPDPAKRPPSGVLVGGYDSSSPFARLWAFEFPAMPAPVEVMPNVNGQPDFGVNWFGQVDAVVRLLHGIDPRIIQALKDAGFDRTAVDNFFSVQNLHTLKLPYNFIFDGMPLQDAIDFAAYLIHIVKGRFRFVAGPKLCGGPVDIAVIKPHQFEWIRRKNLSHIGEI